jgi:hypothetical protein
MPRALASLVLAPLVLAAACGGSGGRAPVGSIPPATGPVTPVPPPAAGPAPDEVIDHLMSADAPTPAICFAWSPSGAVMCDVGASSIQGGAVHAVRILGPGAADLVYYRSPEDQQFFDVDPAAIDRDALAQAKAAAKAGDFRGWDGPAVDVEVGATAAIGGHTLRRTRTETGQDGDPESGVWTLSRDVVELRCGDRWVPLAFTGDVFGNPIEAPLVQVVLLADALLFTAGVTWGIEGDQGGGRDAAMIDPAEVCR